MVFMNDALRLQEGFKQYDYSGTLLLRCFVAIVPLLVPMPKGAFGSIFPALLFNANQALNNIGVIQVRLKQLPPKLTSTKPTPVVEEFFSLYRRYPGGNYPVDLSRLHRSSMLSRSQEVGPNRGAMAEAKRMEEIGRPPAAKNPHATVQKDGIAVLSPLWRNRQMKKASNNIPAAYLALASLLVLLVLCLLVYLLLTCILKSPRRGEDYGAKSMGDESLDADASVFEEDDLTSELEGWQPTVKHVQEKRAKDEKEQLYRNVLKGEKNYTPMRHSSRTSSIAGDSTSMGKYAKRLPLYAPLPPPPPTVPPPSPPQQVSQFAQPKLSVPRLEVTSSGNDSHSFNEENIYHNTRGGGTPQGSFYRFSRSSVHGEVNGDKEEG